LFSSEVINYYFKIIYFVGLARVDDVLGTKILLQQLLSIISMMHKFEYKSNSNSSAISIQYSQKLIS